MKDELVKWMSELDEEKVLSGVREALKKDVSPLEILAALQEGMDEVGTRFAEKEYFLAELVASGDIFKEASELLGDVFQEDGAPNFGTLVIGTVKGDIHDIGKDIVVTIMRSNGFQVVDLGVDVPSENFVEAVMEHQPKFIGLSCLLTTAFDSMKETIEAIEEAGLRSGRKILIGGGPTDEKVRDFVRADVVCENAQEAVEVSKKLLGV